MGLSADEIRREIARRESSGNAAAEAIKAELTRRGVTPDGEDLPISHKIANVGLGAFETLYAPIQAVGEAIRGASEGEPLQVATAQNPAGFRMPSIVQRLSDKYKTSQPPADPFQKTYQGLEGLVQPNIQQAADVVKGQPDAAAQLGGLGMSLAMGKAADPLQGLAMAKKTLFAPRVPAERAFDVATAEKYGLGPFLTRADKTGSSAAAKLESGLGSTLTGGGQISENNKQKLILLEEAQQNIANKFGTQLPPSAVGQEARLGMQGEMGEASATARKLYKEIPDVPIPPSNLGKAIEEIDFKNIDKGASKTIAEIRQRLGHEAPITEATTPTMGSAYSVGPISPGTPPVPTFQKLNDIRNLLSKEIQADTKYNPIIGNQVGEKAQALIPLKKALDADFQAYIEASKKTPYGAMESGQFETAFNKANSFYGTLQQLKSNKLVRKLADPQISASDIPTIVFKSGNIEDINVAKAVLGQDGFNIAKKQFFTDLLGSKNIGRETGKYSDEFLKGVFNREELNALKEAHSLTKTAKTAETMAGNSSRTASHLATMGTLGGLGDAVRRMVTEHPLIGAGEVAAILGVPYGVAKTYLATSRGVSIPTIQGKMAKLAAAISAGAGQGLNVLGQDQNIRQTLMQILQRLQQKDKPQEQP